MKIRGIAAGVTRSRSAWHRTPGGKRLLPQLLDILGTLLQHCVTDRDAGLVDKAVEASIGEFNVRCRAVGLDVPGARDADPNLFQFASTQSPVCVGFDRASRPRRRKKK